jgi:hypothetical protein
MRLLSLQQISRSSGGELAAAATAGCGFDPRRKHFLRARAWKWTGKAETANAGPGRGRGRDGNGNMRTGLKGDARWSEIDRARPLARRAPK